LNGLNRRHSLQFSLSFFSRYIKKKLSQLSSQYQSSDPSRYKPNSPHIPMSSKFEAWKKTRGMEGDDTASNLSRSSTRKSESIIGSPPVESTSHPGLTEEVVSRLNSDYRSQLIGARNQLSRAPSRVSSVRSDASTTSMIERLAKVELALTTMTKVSTHQNTIIKDMKTMLSRQEKLIELLSARVIGETVQPDESASVTSRTESSV